MHSINTKRLNANNVALPFFLIPQMDFMDNANQNVDLTIVMPYYILCASTILYVHYKFLGDEALQCEHST